MSSRRVVSKAVLAAITAGTLAITAGCGGGGGGGGSTPPPSGGSPSPTQPSPPPAPVTATGVFIDSPVSGLSYTSGGQSGLTGDDGSFTYEVGKSVKFEIGGVTLGSAPGAAVITPLDLVDDGTTLTPAVQNIVRFLMLMDSDDDPSNGIAISEALRERAESWQQVDFTAADFEAALASIIPDTQVDGELRQLPTAAQAFLHLQLSRQCLYAGMYQGTYTGGDNGRIQILVTPDGLIGGSAYSIPDDESAPLVTNPPHVLPPGPDVPFTGTIGESTVSGTFPSFDTVSGTWTDGTFSATRYAGTATAAYKFYTVLRQIGGPPKGAVLIEVDAEGAVSAKHSVDVEIDAPPPTLTATLEGADLSITSSSGLTLEGTLDLETQTLTATWTHTDGTSGDLLGTSSCRLR